MKNLASVTCALICGSTSAFGAVQVTNVRHTQHCFAESLDNGLDHDSIVTGQIGAFAGGTIAQAGYPTTVASASADEVSIALADASSINGALTSDAHSRTLEFDQGMSSSLAYVAIEFLLDLPMDIEFAYTIQSVVIDAHASNYTEVGLLDRTSGTYLYLSDFGANTTVQTRERLFLAPGEYEIEFLCESFAGVISDPDAGDNSSMSRLTYDVAFIPAPWTGGLLILFAALRRRT
ncbi:MAG: hypothetical protein RIB32_02825 [Phycisphaerales bacterium]